MGATRRALTFLLAAVAAAGTLLAAGVAAPDARAASARVAALQVALTGVGAGPGPVDGITGPRTVAAVRRFQARRGLAVDGIAGPRTRRALGRRGRPALGSRPLRAGRTGWDVAALQFLLDSRGHGSGGVDGGFGPATLAAVRSFQAAAGLAVDGIAGPATLAALRSGSSAPVVAPGGDDPVRFLRPVSGPIGDGFGYPGGRRHTGLDFPVAAGTPVGAAGRGVVAWAGWNAGGYGNLVVVRHRLGYETWYAHLASISASVGQAVAGGSVLGLAGSTGRSTGPHVHFEVRRFGTPIDPLPRLLTAVSAGRGGDAAGGRRLVCPSNADARGTRDADPPVARIGRCP